MLNEAKPLDDKPKAIKAALDHAFLLESALLTAANDASPQDRDGRRHLIMLAAQANELGRALLDGPPQGLAAFTGQQLLSSPRRLP